MIHSSISGVRYQPIYSSTESVTSKPPNEIESSSKTQRSKRLACISCRQAKLKCVGLRSGTSCSRCQRRSIKCQVDPQYKRVEQHAKLRELSDEVKHLKDLIASDPTASRSRAQASESGQRHDSHDGPISQHSTQTNTGDWVVHASEDLEDTTVQHLSRAGREHAKRSRDYDEACTAQFECSSTVIARELEGVYVNALQVSKLFRIFYQHFHPQMPLVSSAISVDRYFDLSPLLFWTILAITSRSDEAEFGLHLRLSEPLTKILWAKVSTVPMSHFTIQAIVLLCTWPYSTASLMSDPTSMLISVAKAGCMQLGLHRPERMQDYHRVRFEVQREQIEEAVMLWTCCFIAAERVTSGEGHDPVFPTEDPVLVQAHSSEKDYSLPASLRQMLKIHMIVHQLRLAIISHTAHGSHNSPRHLLSPILKSTEMQLDSLQSGLPENLKETISIELACARLQICVMYLQESITASGRQPGLIRAFHAASELVTLLQHASSRPAFCYSAPRYFGQNLKLAALLLLKLRLSTFSCLLDADQVECSYALAISIHHRMTVHDNDFHARAAILLGDIWKIRLKDNVLQLHEPILTLTSRGSANLLYESNWQWRDYYAERAHASELHGRPARILPSIILHSPASQHDADGQQDASSELLSGSPMIMSTTPKQGQEGLIPVTGNSLLSATIPFADQYSHRQDGHLSEQSRIDQSDQLDPLDLMFAYLNPDEEAAQLFYPQWTP